MPAKRWVRWAVMLAALTPMGCQSMCDRWYPCHPAATAYPAYPAAAPGCCTPCCPPPCCPPAYGPTSYQQGSWAPQAPAPVAQTRLTSACCE
jgi:hypothetical protein